MKKQSPDHTNAPAAPGAYILLLRLDTTIYPEIPRFPNAVLTPGWYVYAGSANGPGGLRARINRHLRKGKSRHWHIDHVSEAAAEIMVHAQTGGQECALLDDFQRQHECDIPIPGFGSSDCRTCISHLSRLKSGKRPVLISPLPGRAGFETMT
jgi:Uri superfamily endonuclease